MNLVKLRKTQNKTLASFFMKTQANNFDKFQTIQSKEMKKYRSQILISTETDFRNKNPQRSSSLKRNLFKNAKQTQKQRTSRSNSTKSLINNSPQKQNKIKFPVSKIYHPQGGVVQSKGTAEQIINRLRNKSWIKITNKPTQSNNLEKGKILFQQQPEIKLVYNFDQSKDKQINEYFKKLETVKDQAKKIEDLFQKKSFQLKRLDKEIQNKTTFFSNMMQKYQKSFKDKQKQLFEKQTSIINKEKTIFNKELQIESKIQRVIQQQYLMQKNRHRQEQVQKQKVIKKIEKIESIQNKENKVVFNTEIQNKQRNQKKQGAQTLNQHQFLTKQITHKSQITDHNVFFKTDIVVFEDIQQVKFEQQSVDSKQKKPASKKTNQKKKQQIIEPTIQIKKSKIDALGKSSESTKKEPKYQNKLIVTVKQQQKTNPTTKQQKQNNDKSQLLKQQKTRLQKQNMEELVKAVGRAIELLYFIGQIPYYCTSNMKKNKKFSFKNASLFLYKYVYDKFRYFQEVLLQLYKKKAATKQQYEQRISQNQKIKQTYKKVKDYAYKKQPYPSKKWQKYLEVQVDQYCFQDSNFFKNCLFKQINEIISFYHKQTKGKWSQHTVNICYFRMLISVFIIQQIQFNNIILQSDEEQEYPDYKLDQIQKYTENQLKDRMTECYQILLELDTQ